MKEPCGGIGFLGVNEIVYTVGVAGFSDAWFKSWIMMLEGYSVTTVGPGFW